MLRRRINGEDIDGKYRAIVSSGGGIYTSSDYGKTWILKLSDLGLFRKAAISGNGKYWAAFKEGAGDYTLYSSSDYGVTWNSKITAISSCNMAMSLTGQYQLISGYNGHVSSDYGETWGIIARTTDGSFYPKSGVMSYDGSFQMAFSMSKFYKSVDFGRTWSPLSSQKYSEFSWSVHDMSKTGQYIAIIGDGSARIFSDYGVTDTYLEGGLSMSISGNGQYIIIGGDRSLYTSTDYGVTFKVKKENGKFLNTAMSASGKHQMAFKDDGGTTIYQSSNYGESWNQANINGSISCLVINKFIK